MRLRRPGHAVVVAYLALFVAATGTATAATGGALLLGRANAASRTTTLSNSGGGAALRLRTHSRTSAPLSVSGNTNKVPGLNADLLDGLTSSQLQRRVVSSCGRGGTIARVRSSGGTACGPRVLWAVVRANGSVARGTSGASAKAITTGAYEVDFGVDVRRCAYVGSVGDPGTAASAPGFVTTATRSGNPRGVFVGTWNSGGKAASLGFQLMVACAPA
ncbi:MAG TPA: hypothetical protein VMI11_05065 [Actinomycetes bacterium]|nr:hypothetical protein [Actinomycetes bacterium]